jgi:hypothetical protein
LIRWFQPPNDMRLVPNEREAQRELASVEDGDRDGSRARCSSGWRRRSPCVHRQRLVSETNRENERWGPRWIWNRDTELVKALTATEMRRIGGLHLGSCSLEFRRQRAQIRAIGAAIWWKRRVVGLGRNYIGWRQADYARKSRCFWDLGGIGSDRLGHDARQEKGDVDQWGRADSETEERGRVRLSAWAACPAGPMRAGKGTWAQEGAEAGRTDLPPGLRVRASRLAGWATRPEARERRETPLFLFYFFIWIKPLNTKIMCSSMYAQTCS